jgi:L-gulonate 5-dehydrogenase
MRAAIFDAPRRMHVGGLATPQPGPDEVVVAVGATGVCAGDMYIYLGKNPYAEYPVIGGHEIAGTVHEVGNSVQGIDPGAQVVVEPFIGCGTCYPCRIGKPNCCMNLQIIGMHRPGGFAEYVVAPAANVHLVPAGLSMSIASFAEPIAIGVQSCRRGAVAGGDDVLILGCGPIGLALIEVAHARGARVVATDVQSDRLETARSLGAEVVAGGEALLPAIMERTNGEGMPVVIEATGNTKAMESTVDLVAAGGRIVIVGLAARGAGVTFPALDFTRKEMTIVGSRASTNCFPEALDLLARGAITYPRLATEVSMWQAPELFANLAEHPGTIHKVVFLT